jgi:hypothetical protein
MAIFAKKSAPVAAPVSGTQRLRSQLIAWTRRRTTASVVAGINEAATDASRRATSQAMAKKMSADDADEKIVNSLARTLANGFTGGEVRILSEDMLEDFADGKADLPDAAKCALALHLSNGYHVWDSATDQLVPTNTRPPATLPKNMPRWRHPDENVARARDALHDALRDGGHVR